jgi:hypothetical protein
MTQTITVEKGFQGHTARSQRSCYGNGKTIVYRVMVDGEEYASFKRKMDAVPVAEFAQSHWNGLGDLETAYHNFHARKTA